MDEVDRSKGQGGLQDQLDSQGCNVDIRPSETGDNQKPSSCLQEQCAFELATKQGWEI
jgi:hypothetical protein